VLHRVRLGGVAKRDERDEVRFTTDSTPKPPITADTIAMSHTPKCGVGAKGENCGRSE